MGGLLWNDNKVVLTTTDDSGVITQGRPTPTSGVQELISPENFHTLSVRNVI